MNSTSEAVRTIITILKTLRIRGVSTEAEIHEAIGQALKDNGLRFRHEYSILSRKRFDFWLSGVVIEVKKKKPGKVALLNQLNRYTKVPEVKAIIIVMQESMHLPKSLNGKPLICLSLNANWGVAF